LMAVSFAPTLRFYRLALFWGIPLPAICLLYKAFSIDSAHQHARRGGGMRKGRVAPRKKLERLRRDQCSLRRHVPASSLLPALVGLRFGITLIREAWMLVTKAKTRLKTFYAAMAVTRLEEWCVEAETPEEAQALLAAGQGHRC